MTLPELLAFCADRDLGTKRQRECVSATIKHGTQVDAAKAMGINTRTLQRSIQKLKMYAASVGFAPDHDLTSPTAEGFVLDKASLLYDGDGEVKLKWLKIKAERADLLERLREYAELLREDVKGLAKRKKAPKIDTKTEMTVYPQPDLHIGMYACAEECGEAYNRKQAQSDAISAAEALISGGPATETALIVNLGDFFHNDDSSNRTPGHKHPLDVDGRYHEVLQTGVSLQRAVIDMALEKHKRVYIYNILGNHDPHTGYALSLILEGYYHKEPRVVIDTGPQQFKRHRFGKTLIAMAHGHTAKPEALNGVMLREWPQDCGETAYRYWLTGHRHHREVKHLQNSTVEIFSTIIPRDAYHANAGYGADRDMVRITYHKEYGEWGRQRAPIEYIRKLGEKKCGTN